MRTQHKGKYLMSEATPATTPAGSDPATSAPATSATPSPGITIGTPPSGSAEGTDPAAAATTIDPWTGLDADNLKVVQNKGWKSPADAIKSYSELERLNSQRPQAPAPAAAVSDYDFAKPEGAVDYSDEFANKFKEWSFGQKLSKEQATGIHDAFFGWAQEQTKAANDALMTAVTETKSALVKEWGAEQTPEFTRNLNLAVRAAKNLGIHESLERAGVFAKINGVTTASDAKVMSALAKVGNAMFSEDRLFGEVTAASNPFDPKTEDLMLQGRLFKEDPQKAKALIYAAKQEANFGYLLSQIK
jgi:hypothetical protein